jgi:LAO/AO transport system kinase
MTGNKPVSDRSHGAASQMEHGAGPDHEELLSAFDGGSKAALARVVSIVENHRAGFDDILARLHGRLGRARRVGITGPPGAGKSSLSNLLVQHYRTLDLSVGVIAVDPTSPFTGGALLGDRIRMESVALDPKVFIRSMATRGSLGGLAVSTREVADVFDAFGVQRIIIETVGVGQSELDIARTADTSVVVLVPESGDSIQTLKAGLMEIADIFVVNKSDRPGGDRLRMELELMLGLRAGDTLRDIPAHHGVSLNKPANPMRAARAAAAEDSDSWTPPVLQTVATQEKGIPPLAEALERHWAYLERSGSIKVRRRARLRQRVIEIVEERIRRRLWRNNGVNEFIEERLEAILSGELNPFRIADELLRTRAMIVARDPE